MLNIEPYTDVTFINAYILLYYMYCREYRDAYVNKDEASIKVYGDACTAFEDLAEILGIDVDIRIPFERAPECCASCKHWDALSTLSKPDPDIDNEPASTPWDELPDMERRAISKSGNCVKICESACPDQNCNYEMMNTDKTFCCIHYEKWIDLK